MEKKHSEKEKTSLDSPSPKLNKSMIAYHETGDLFADTCEISSGISSNFGLTASKVWASLVMDAL